MKKKQQLAYKKIRQIDSEVTYWDYLNTSAHTTVENGSHITHEPVMANPDSLIDEPNNKPWGNPPPKLAKILIDEYMNEQGDFDILSPQENQVLRLYTADQSLGQVALEMKITKSSVVTYLKRVGSKLRKVLKPLEGEI